MPYVDKSEQGVKLLEKLPLKVVLLSKEKMPAGKPKPRERPRKQIVVEETAIPES